MIVARLYETRPVSAPPTTHTMSRRPGRTSLRHRERRDATVAALREKFPNSRIEGIAAGLHLVLPLPDDQDDRQIAIAAREAGVIVRPLSHCYSNNARPGLIINYAAHHPVRIAEAISRLARVALPT